MSINDTSGTGGATLNLVSNSVNKWAFGTNGGTPNFFIFNNTTGISPFADTTAGALTIGDAGATNIASNSINGITVGTSGQATINKQLITATGTPTIASGACGTAANGVITSGDNQAGLITIGAVATTACAVSFSGTLPAAPKACLFSAANATAAGATILPRISAISATGFTLSGAVLASTAFYYHCY